MEIEVVKFDNLGRGIGFINNKIIFVKKSVPGDIVTVQITKEKKNYLEGEIKDIIKPSKLRKDARCPYFNLCGGCDLMNISLTNELEYKLTKVNDILHKEGINTQVNEIIRTKDSFNYRNKITLKVIDGKIGYFLSDTHDLIAIDNCYLVKDVINKLISDLKCLHVKEGEIIIRCNYKDELLLIINSLDKIDSYDYLIDNYKISGIVYNDKCIYGDNYLIQKINNYLFKVSYNSFFQVNNDICSKLFTLIEEETKNSRNIIDLYCGVGTLSIVASNSNNNVLGVEIVENAIIDANLNKGLNRKENINFICSDTVKVIDKIESKYDTIILDPPRSGVNEKVLRKIIMEKIAKIIYVSCDPFTLTRDLLILKDYYNIKEFKLLDMFVWSEHVESFVVLERIM